MFLSSSNMENDIHLIDNFEQPKEKKRKEKNKHFYFLLQRNDQTSCPWTSFRPRILIDVSNIDMTTTVLGFKISMPIMIAPTAMQKMAHPDGNFISENRGCFKALFMTNPLEVSINGFTVSWLILISRYLLRFMSKILMNSGENTTVTWLSLILCLRRVCNCKGSICSWHYHGFFFLLLLFLILLPIIKFILRLIRRANTIEIWKLFFKFL